MCLMFLTSRYKHLGNDSVHMGDVDTLDRNPTYSLFATSLVLMFPSVMCIYHTLKTKIIHQCHYL